MWDSFGHIEHAQATHAELMQKFDYSDDSASYLRPGDTLTIEIEVDPSFSDEGFMVKWSSNYVDDQAGERLVKFVLPIENQHVGRELPISVKLFRIRTGIAIRCGTISGRSLTAFCLPAESFIAKWVPYVRLRPPHKTDIPARPPDVCFEG